MKLFRNKFFISFIVLLLVICITVPCFAITPSYTEPSGYSFIESAMRKILIKRYNYNLSPNANKTFDNQFSYAVYPFSDTVSEFDAIIDNASIFIGGVNNGIMQTVKKAYRFITFNPHTNTTNFIMYIAQSTIYSEATFTLEPRAGLNGVYYRLKQNNKNSGAAGSTPTFNYVCVSFPRSWAGGTSGVTYKKFLVQNNNFSEDQYCSFAYPNLLWADTNTLSLLPSINDTWINYYSNHHFVSGAHIQNVNPTRLTAVDINPNSKDYVISLGYDSSRPSSTGQYYLDFELYYDGFNVSDDFLKDLLKYQDPIRFPSSNSVAFDTLSYELLSGSSTVVSSSGYVLRVCKFRVWIQPQAYRLSLNQFTISWYTSIEWGTPISNNSTIFELNNTGPNDTTSSDITQIWDQLSGSLEFFRFTVSQLWTCFPSDIYYLVVAVIYLTILVAGLRLIL